MKCAICAIAKNENDYINDWVKYHIDLGFDEIYLFDNNEPDAEYVGNRISKDYLSHVVIVPVNHFKQFQKKAYNDMYSYFGKDFDWTAFIDVDEYIVLSTHKNVKDFLQTIKPNIECVRLNWQTYGDDGIIAGDISVPVYKRIVKKLDHPYNKHGKCIVKGGLKNVIFESVHYPTIQGKMPSQCLPSGNVLSSDAKINLNVIEYDVAYIAHYMTKTWEEFKKQKLNRTDAALSRHLTTDYFRIVNPITYNILHKHSCGDQTYV